MIRNPNIQQQMALITLIPLLILTIFLESFLLHGRFADLDLSLMERGKLIARQMASSSEYGVFTNNQEFLRMIANGSLREPDVRGVAILNASSEILLTVGSMTSAKFETGSTLKVAQQNGSKLTHAKWGEPPTFGGIDVSNQIKESNQSIWLYQPIVPTQVAVDDLDISEPAKKIGAVIVEMSKAHTEQDKLEMLIVALISTVLFLMIALYLIYRASLSITRPIHLMSKAVEKIAKGDLGTRTKFSTNVVELSTLAHGLNEMGVQLEQDREILQQRIDQATQALREKKDEAVLANQDKSRFLAAASHDLRQPLHALGLYVAELRRQLSSSSQRHLVEQVEQSVDALVTLLNALLDISKLDSGGVIPQYQSCRMSAIISRVEADYHMLAAIKNVKLVVRTSSLYVNTDPILLERILTNLVSNAIRYSHPGGCVMIACRKRGNQLRIEIRDNGIGISREDQSNIFNEFFQVSKPQLDSSKGQGLGLAIVDRLVKLLDLGIELRSTLGRGSIFALRVPIDNGQSHLAVSGKYPALQSAMTVEKLPLQGKSVLVIDDDELVLASTATILASWGGAVETANNLDRLQALLSAGAVWDLIISDYQLADDETGIDVIAMVRKYTNNQTPAILISGDTSTDLLQLANTAGHHLMHKPVKPAKLRSLLMFLLNESRSD